MKVILRIPQTVYRTAVEDLKRAHDFAGERVGFMFGRVGSGRTDTLLLVSSYEAVPDDGYVRDDYVSARINATTIRTMMQRTLTTGESAFHVHVHDHQGTPALSWLDESELARLMPSFARTAPSVPHGAIVLSRNRGAATIWLPEESISRPVEIISVVGHPIRLWRQR